MSLRLMYDSTNPLDIPVDAQMVAGYVDGLYAWPQLGWDRFPDAVKVRIAVDAFTDDGHVLDVENGAATPVSAPWWATRRRAAGITPSVYMNGATWPAVRQAFIDARVREPYYWLALWDGQADVPSGTIAKQYANPTFTHQHFDLSAVSAFWPGVDELFGSGTGGATLDPRLQQLLIDLYPQSADPSPRGRLTWLLSGDSDDTTAAVPPGSLTPAQAQQLSDILAKLTGLTLKAA